MIDIGAIIQPIFYIVIIIVIIKPILEMIESMFGFKFNQTPVNMKFGKKEDKIKIQELSDIVYNFMKKDCLIHGSTMAKKLYLRTGLDTKIYIGKIKGWNKDKEMTYFYIKRPFKRFVIITNKEIDTLHYQAIIKSDTLKHFTNNILYLTQYENEESDYNNIYNYLIKYYLSVMNIQSFDGQYYNMISVYRKKLADQINYATLYNRDDENDDKEERKI